MDTTKAPISPPALSLGPITWCKNDTDWAFASRSEAAKIATGEPSQPTGDSELFRACSVYMNQEVLLIHWPPKMTAKNICADNGIGEGKTLGSLSDVSRTFVTSALTFRGANLYPRGEMQNGNTSFFEQRSNWKYVQPSTLTGPFTFTSPTVYIAHRPLTALFYGVFVRQNETITRESLSTLQTASILGLHSTEVSSRRLFGFEKPSVLQYAQLVAQGRFDRSMLYTKIGNNSVSQLPEQELYETLPFNYGHLEDPVPASVFFDARADDCWGRQTHCGTITDDSYQPQLVIHSSVWARYGSLLSAFDCEFPHLVDPPIALSEIPRDEVGRQVPTLMPALTTPYQPAIPQSTAKPAQPLPAVASSGPLPTGVYLQGGPSDPGSFRMPNQLGKPGRPNGNYQGTNEGQSNGALEGDEWIPGDYFDFGDGKTSKENGDDGVGIRHGIGLSSGASGLQGVPDGRDISPEYGPDRGVGKVNNGGGRSGGAGNKTTSSDGNRKDIGHASNDDNTVNDGRNNREDQESPNDPNLPSESAGKSSHSTKAKSDGAAVKPPKIVLLLLGFTSHFLI